MTRTLQALTLTLAALALTVAISEDAAAKGRKSSGNRGRSSASRGKSSYARQSSSRTRKTGSSYAARKSPGRTTATRNFKKNTAIKAHTPAGAQLRKPAQRTPNFVQTVNRNPQHTGRNLGKRDFGKRDFGKRDFGKRDLGKRDFGKRDLGKRAGQKQITGRPLILQDGRKKLNKPLILQDGRKKLYKKPLILGRGFHRNPRHRDLFIPPQYKHRPWCVVRPRHCWWWFKSCRPLQLCHPRDYVYCNWKFVRGAYTAPTGQVVQNARWYLGVNGMILPGSGLGIDEVAKGSPAERAGLKPGMVIQNCNGVDLADEQALMQVVKQSNGQLRMTVQVEEGAEPQTIDIAMQRLASVSY